MNESIKTLKSVKLELENKIFVQKQDVKELESAMEELKIKHRNDLETALSNLNKEMNQVHLDSMKRMQQKLESEHTAAIELKNTVNFTLKNKEIH